MMGVRALHSARVGLHLKARVARIRMLLERFHLERDVQAFSIRCLDHSHLLGPRGSVRIEVRVHKPNIRFALFPETLFTSCYGWVSSAKVRQDFWTIISAGFPIEASSCLRTCLVT